MEQTKSSARLILIALTLFVALFAFFTYTFLHESGHALTGVLFGQSLTEGVFVVIREINTTYFDLSVTGTDGYSSVVIHGEGYNAIQDGGLWEENLPAGTYQVVLTSHQSPGTVSVYIKDK